MVICQKLDKIKNDYDQPDVRLAKGEAAVAKNNAVWSETHLEDVWTELCQVMMMMMNQCLNNTLRCVFHADYSSKIGARTGESQEP